MMKHAFVWLLVLTISVMGFAQGNIFATKKKGFVTVDAVAPITLAAGKTAKVEVRFRVNPGYHVNSNHPGSELLIPTEIEFATAPAKLTIGKIAYPKGEELALQFDPKEKLSVYTGDVAVMVPLSAAKDAKAGDYTVKGELHYQACNDNSCFPPKSLPVEVKVRVIRPTK